MKTKISNNEKAANRIKNILATGAVVTVHAYMGYYTVGKFTPAIGEGGFAVYGYGKGVIPAREFTGVGAIDRAAWAVVSSCGSTRTREAALTYKGC